MKKNKIVKFLLAQGTEIAVMLLLVSLFFGLLTTLLLRIFPAGITLTQILQQRNSRGGGAEGGRSAGGAVFDLQKGETVEQAAATLSQIGNEVRSKGAASIAWGPAQEGMRLKDHDAVQTFNQSSARIAFDGSNYLTMGSNSLVIVKRIEKETTRNVKHSSIVVVDGQLQGRIASSRVNIATPSATVKMVGGAAGPKSDFKISVNPDHSSTVVVLHGQAEVSAQGKTVQVAENCGVTVKEGEAPRAALRLPPPPEQLVPTENGKVHYRDLPQRVRFAWSPAKGGTGYRLQLARDKGFRELIVDRQLAETEFIHGNLKRGVYFWRVGSSFEGMEGATSGGRRLEVLQSLAEPLLQVTFPAGRVAGRSCTVAGSTAPGNTIFVAGKAVATDQRGAFSCEVPIRDGMTLVTVEAVDPSGNVTYRSHYIEGRREP